MIQAVTSLLLLSLAVLGHAQSTTTSKPLPIFLPTVPNMVVTNYNDGNQTCIIYNAGIRFSFNYTTAAGKVIGQTDLPTTGFNVTGFCGGNQNISIAFYDDWVLTYQFTQDSAKTQWWVNEVTLQYYLNPGQEPFKDILEANNGTATMKNNTWYVTGTGSSYQCVAAQTMNATEPQSGSTFVGIGTYTLQIQGYHSTNDTKFANPIGCPADQVSNIVPIAVGAALGALVIIVLIAYFIGRSRNKRGYESV